MLRQIDRGESDAIRFLLLLIACWVTVLLRPMRLNATAATSTNELSPLISNAVTGIPFSFIYGGKPSRKLLTRWVKKQATRTLADGSEDRRVVYRDPRTGLEVTDEIIIYKGFPAADWVLRLRNTGSSDTPIIEDIRPLDLRFTVPGGSDLILHSAHGSSAKSDDFLPITKILSTQESYSAEHYVMQGGKQVRTGFPYFDVHWQNGGIIGAIGWTGQWSLQIRRDSRRSIILRAGQENTHFKLRPGESVRTPRLLLLEWKGDHWSGHNEFRRLLIAHYLPKLDGKPVRDPISHTGAYAFLFDGIARKTGENPLNVFPTLQPSDLNHAHGLPTPGDALNWVNEQNQLELIRGLRGSGIEAYWLDAGWFQGGWPFGAGNWVPDKEKFPRGLKPLGDAAHGRGLKFILWFEPKRVAPGTLISKEHPGWILHSSAEGKWGGIFDLGIPEARQWMRKLLSARIREWGVNIYRNDSNICPLPFWKSADRSDRQGITEIRDVEGLYKLWSGLLKDNPGLMIDNANWRITGPDIEVMKRSIGSLTRSEVDDSGIPYPVFDQAQTAELSLWVPLDATIVHGLDPYIFRSAATTGTCIGLDLRSKYIPLNQLRSAVAEVKSLRPFWFGDYYPLTRIDTDKHSWCGWQFNRPDLDAGFAIFFRRSQSSQKVFRASLHGLNRDEHYEVTFCEKYGAGPKRIMTGAELENLPVKINSSPESMVIRYENAARLSELLNSRTDRHE